MIITLLGKKWSIQILFALERGGRTFSYFLNNLFIEKNGKKTYISSKMLTQRLKELTENGLTKRELYEDRSTKYFLTEYGKKTTLWIRQIEEKA